MLLSLAPMQDVTDLAFMRVLARIGSLPDYFVTAYFRSTPTTCAMVEDNLRCITENETGVPIWAQIAGSCPHAITRDVAMLQQYPIAGIDLNAGCPSPLVNRNNAGAGLLRDTRRFSDIVLAMRDSIPEGQFSIKIRTGWGNAEEELPHLLELVAEARPDRVAVHGRTRQQLYGGQADWQAIARAVHTLSPCPVMGNGDICSVEDAQRAITTATPAGLMIGRGAVRNPYIFRQLHGGAAPTEEEMKHYYEALIEETGRILHTKRTEKGHCNRLKKYLTFIYPNLCPEQEYQLRRCTQISDMRRLLEL